jgi:hypothetical protein
MFRKIIYITFYPLLIKIFKMKNAYNGKVYILGDSAEIKLYDLKLFDDAPMLCFNRSILLNDIKQRKNNTIHLMGEPFFFVPGKHDSIRQIEVEYLKRNIISSDRSTVIHLSNFPFLKKKNIDYVFYKFPRDKNTSSLVKKNIKPFQWTGSIAIHLALYMGFNEIVFIGISNHTYPYLSHWYKKGLRKDSRSPNFSVDATRGLKGYDSNNLKASCEISTIVSNPISKSIFKTVFYEEYTGHKIAYRENTELVDNDYLEILEQIYPGEVL